MVRVVRKSSSNKISTKNVRSTRQPSRIREMGDADFGPLNSSKNGYVVTYDSVTNDFMLMSPDDVLIRSTSTPAPDEFVDQLEQQLDLGTIAIGDIDGGGF